MSTRSVSAQELESGGLKAPFEEPADETMSTAGIFDAPQSTDLPQSLTEDAAHDAGGGKVRGPNGRYMPKNKTTPGSGKSYRSTGSTRAKPGRKCRQNHTVFEYWFCSNANTQQRGLLKKRTSHQSKLRRLHLQLSKLRMRL